MTSPPTQKYERKCKNWLQDFGRWTMPRSEAPATFIFWTGLFTLSSALRRKVFIPRQSKIGSLGSWEVAPNLYILFIAPAGRARKTTTANYSEDLLDYVPNITRSPELITKEKLLLTLAQSNDSSMCIVAPEFGEFIVKSGVEMFGFLTNMYDGKKRIAASTLSRPVDFAERPCVNLLGATTPEWVGENMPESVIGGGFASRVIFIFEERVRRRKMFYDDVDWEEMTRLQNNLVADLLHISENLTGAVSFTQEAKEYMETWYETNAEEGGVSSYKMHGYFERKPAHILKVAMLVHIAYSDDLVLNVQDIMDAIEHLKSLEKKLPSVFQTIGHNPYTVDIYRILEFVLEQGAPSKEMVRRHFMHAAVPSMINELIEGLSGAGYITQEIVGMDTFLKPTKLALGMNNGHVESEPSVVSDSPES